MTSSPPSPRLSSLTIAADVDEISRVSAWLEELGEQEDWAPQMLFGLELSVEEALANVITHGFENTCHDPEIVLEYFRPAPEAIGIRIIDNGVAFDPTAQASPQLAENVEEARIGGHGLRFMRHYLSDFGYARVGDRNELTLIAGPKAATDGAASP